MTQATTVTADETILIEHLPFEVDDGIANRASVGPVWFIV